ncbi:hypothetical protein SKAU_G00084820 [Synaphobranchus kaupii]|uniref:Uncharacterized protein n=1 Tax=Synaphobranchus kaupii TaxID=118154 RepID=A0A9Q1FV75_SYNKA|nr:hypothetical protein SKAU_G00084820 [Synaphobranchus kaupii]
MFAEEEWNDDPDAEALTRAVICGTERSDNTNVTPKGVGKKRSLMRTLQTLGSVPNWTNGSLREGSDSESEEVPSTTKRKKKRSKKRRRARAAGDKGEEVGQQEGEEEDAGAGEEEDAGAVVARKKRPKQAKSTNAGKPELVRDRQRKDSDPEKKDEGESALSRQQWRNKTKMKKKSKNKFRPHDETTTDTTKTVSSVANNEKKTVQAQTLKGENKAQKQDRSKARKRTKAEEGKEERCVSLANKKQRENKKAKIRDEPEGMAEGTKLEESTPQAETEVKGPELGVQRKPQQSKEKRMLAEKMRRMLHSDGSSSKERSTEEEERGGRGRGE